MTQRTISHAAHIVSHTTADVPADMALKRYFVEKHFLNATERRDISHTVFAYYRWFGWLDANKSRSSQIEKAVELNTNYINDKKSVKEQAITALSVPAWLKDEMPVTPEFVRQLQTEPVLWLRARPDKALELKTSLGDCAQTPFSKDALQYNGTRDLFLSPSFKNGDFQIQDLSSQLVSVIASPKPGETWWDVCSGEGGKTLHLADLLQNKGVVWATDRSLRRLEVLKTRTKRAKIFNYRTKPWEGGVLIQDPKNPEVSHMGKLPFKTLCDGILLDAPCSGVGTWRRNPHARWTLTQNDIKELSDIQKRLLKQVSRLVKPGGLMVYAVCTLTTKETTEVFDHFTAENPDFKPELKTVDSLHSDPLSKPGSLFLWPQTLNANGMYVATWRRQKK
jgi:16S rRNA (cytosine967-C5)-methyltransferase